MFDRPPPPPPSPDYPLGVVAASPPAPPVQTSFQERIDLIRNQLIQMEYRRDFLIQEITTCIPSRTNFCGRSSYEAPNPWISTNGEYCRGWQTRSVREHDVCGFWASVRNLNAADSDEYDDLYHTGGSCFSARGAELRCSPQADRLARSGAYELQVMRVCTCVRVFFRSRVFSVCAGVAAGGP